MIHDVIIYRFLFHVLRSFYTYVLVCIDACPQLAHGIVNLVNELYYGDLHAPSNRLIDPIRKIFIISIEY